MRGQSILVVAESLDDRDLLTRVLQPHYEVETALSAEPVLAGDAEAAPVLLVLAFGADGPRALERWRSDAQTRNIPVLGIPAADASPTAGDPSEEADDYVTRPLDGHQVLARVRLLLRQRELTERVRQKEQSIAVLDSLLAHAPIGFACFDHNYRYLRINEFLGNLYGQPAALHIGRTLREMVPVHAPFIEPILERILATGEAVRNVEIIGETPKAPGVVRHWLCSFFPVHVGERTDSVGALIADITERKRTESALLESDRGKDRFLATLSHELRNPLAPICNALEILQTPDVSPADATYARDLLNRQVRQMVRLIDDLLDVSRLHHGRIELKRERVTLDHVVNAALETCRPAMDAGGQELKVSLPPRQVVLDADPLRLAQVLANLLHNATKYTGPKGRISLSAELDGDSVIVRVRDTGIGIREEQLPHVFDMFKQAAPAGTGGRGGLGVGLGLVKALVEQHGGTVAAASAGLGTGSEFTLRLPRATAGATAAPSPPPAAAPTSRPGGRRVLIVDDSVDAARSLARLLRLSGNDVRTAHDGPAALQVLPEFRPEVMFLDIGMPGMDGYEVARRVRKSRVPDLELLVALTGWGQEEDRRRSREAGFDLHLVKPVEPEQLRELLAQGHEPGAGA